MDKEYDVPQTTFGNVNDEDFLDIWNSGAYKSFRKIYEDRLRGGITVSKAFDIFAGSGSRGTGKEPVVEIPPLPEVCRTCYKAYGL